MEKGIDNIKGAVETAVRKEVSKFRELIQKELASKVYSKIEEIKKNLSGQALVDKPKEPKPGETTVKETGAPMAPSAPPSTPLAKVKPGDLRIIPTSAGANKDDVSLDPNFEKEYYQRSYDYKGQKVIVKQVGTGFGKPVRIYINDRRWEFFPGPKAADAATREYIDGMVKAAKQDPQLGAAMTAKVKEDQKTGLAAAPKQADAVKDSADLPNQQQQIINRFRPGNKPKPGGAAPTKPKPPTPPKPKF